MAKNQRICEVCGRIQQVDEDNLPEKTYDIYDVCEMCTDDQELNF